MRFTIVFLIFSFCCFGQQNLYQKPVSRPNIINVLKTGLDIDEIKNKYGIPFDTHKQGTNKVVLQYLYWPEEKQPINKLGLIPNGIDLIFVNGKLIDWKENYFRYDK